MHELSFSQNLLDLALLHALRGGPARVTDLYLVVGELSKIVDASVQFYWDLIAEGTPCEGAQLHFRRVQAALFCRDCKTEYALVGELCPCPACGGSSVEVIRGCELRLESIDLVRERMGEST